MTLLQLGGINRDVSSIVGSGALRAFVALLVLSAVATWLVRRRPRGIEHPPLLWFAGFASLAIVLAVTLLRDEVPLAFDLAGLAHWSTHGLELLSRDPLGSSQFILNIVLFVPAGVMWTWIVKRPLLVLLALMCTSLVIELVQAVTAVGVPDVADLVANTLGAAIGVGIAATIDAFASTEGGRPRSRSQLVAGTAVVVGVIVLAVLGMFVGASHRQQSVEDALRAKFGGTNRSIIGALLVSDPNAVFGAVADFADGTRSSTDVVEVRYPATFLGLDRCVYVAWTASGVDFRKESGQACTEFIDGGFTP
jgi:hypothetical protein